MAPDSISASPHPLFPGTDVLQGASGGVRCHCVDQVMSQPFHSSCTFLFSGCSETLRGEDISLICRV